MTQIQAGILTGVNIGGFLGIIFYLQIIAERLKKK